MAIFEKKFLLLTVTVFFTLVFVQTEASQTKDQGSRHETVGVPIPKTQGVFEILSIGPRIGIFRYVPSSDTPEKSTRRTYTVDAGRGGDVQAAIIARMIAIIREQYPDNFNWQSIRLGRVVILSARREDETELAQFLMADFFGQRANDEARAIASSSNRLIYPEEAKKKGEAGTTLIRALVDESGQVKSTMLIHSSGFSDLDIEADRWVRSTKFKPYFENGIAQSVYAKIPVIFKLDLIPHPSDLKITMSDARSIGDRIRANTIYAMPDNLEANDPVEYNISLNATGFVTDIKLLKSSGLVDFDIAVLHAIEKSQPFPPDAKGVIPSSFVLSHRPLQIQQGP
jgi:TonB family protein